MLRRLVSACAKRDPRAPRLEKGLLPTVSAGERDPAFFDPFPNFQPRREFLLEENPHWLVSHMNRAKLEIPKAMKTVDVIVEVRDCRAPLTTAQYELSEEAKVLTSRQRLIVLNKADLVTPRVALKARELIEAAGLPCITTSAVSHHKIIKIKEFIQEKVQLKFKSVGLWMMLIGLPNMGKSSIINALKKQTEDDVYRTLSKDEQLKQQVKTRDARVTKKPGTTLAIDRFLISAKPKIYCLDSPGITFLKDHLDPERNLRLAALGVIPDHVAGEMYIADYILWRLNRARKFEYVDVFELKEPVDNSQFLMTHIATILSSNKRQFQVDVLAGARFFTALFREGKLGKICLDDIPDADQVITPVNFEFETEPPGPWGPSTYPQQKWLKALI